MKVFDLETVLVCSPFVVMFVLFYGMAIREWVDQRKSDSGRTTRALGQKLRDERQTTMPTQSEVAPALRFGGDSTGTLTFEANESATTGDFMPAITAMSSDLTAASTGLTMKVKDEATFAEAR